MGEDSFLQAIHDSPKPLDSLCVYADWLDDQGGPVSAAKAEFLRLTVEGATTKGTRGQRKKRQKRLQQLAASLDTDWLAVVSRLVIENCPRKRADEQERASRRSLFTFVCDKKWEDLRPTDDRAVRFCDGCQQSVHYCDTIVQARDHAWQGHCIAVDLGIIRRERDLEPEWLMAGLLGRPSPEYLQEEMKRMRPDPVSAEREKRKQEEAALRKKREMK